MFFRKLPVWLYGSPPVSSSGEILSVPLAAIVQSARGTASSASCSLNRSFELSALTGVLDSSPCIDLSVTELVLG